MDDSQTTLWIASDCMRPSITSPLLPRKQTLLCVALNDLTANNGNQAARLARSPANAALPVRVASDIVSKKSDCRTGLLLPAV
jgi:hypothetical protein